MTKPPRKKPAKVGAKKAPPPVRRSPAQTDAIVATPRRQSAGFAGTRDLAALVERVVAIIEDARSRVVRTVNSEMVLSYWHIGREIVKYVQRGEARAEYGKEVIEGLSRQLLTRVGKGYSARNLWYFRDFYVTYRDRTPRVRAEGFRTSLVQNSKPGDAPRILREAGAELAEGFSSRLSWTHYRALLAVSDPAARAFYEIEAEHENWSTPHLERQIFTSLHLIDLKLGRLTHQDVGQMDSYVRLFDAHERTPGDGPTIGLILCAEENHTIARYSVLSEHKQLFAAKYLTHLPTEEELRRELDRDRRLAEASVEASHAEEPTKPERVTRAKGRKK